MSIRDATKQPSYDPSELAIELTAAAKSVKKIGFIGLGAMGFGMASHLLKSGFSVIAYDVTLSFDCFIFLIRSLQKEIVLLDVEP
jgi:UDP-N-acetyl-D-mannosaminuronate dehydrogenase